MCTERHKSEYSESSTRSYVMATGGRDLIDGNWLASLQALICTNCYLGSFEAIGVIAKDVVMVATSDGIEECSIFDGVV